MDFIKIRFSEDFGELGAKFEKTIEDMFRTMSAGFTLAERTWKPPMDMNETPEEIVIVAEVAGVDKRDLDVEISSRAVRIRGKRAPRHCQPQSTYLLAEIQYGRFERVIFLPAPIDPEVVSAAYANGFLEIRMAKLPQDRVRKVAITEG